MPNEDNRRRRDGSTAQLSVAELLARREAETQPIPRITDEVVPDEQTVRFPRPDTNLSGHELHITELLRREGRPAEEAVAGGVSVPKLVAMASGGVVLCGSVAFGATQWLSSPDERPLAEVRFDTRPAARNGNALTDGLAAAAAARQQAQAPQGEQTSEQRTPEQRAQAAPETTTPSRTAQKAPQAGQQAPRTTTTTTTTTEQQPPSTTEQPPSSSTGQPATTPPSAGTTTPPSSSGSATPSTSTPPATPPSSTPSSGTSTPPTSGEQGGVGIGIGLDLGGVLRPIGGFDFFSPAS
ncbi:hypothetical protein JOF41_005479 [Saccharothrix coeruleofusca]|uniref:hypothetical protein n=1 Tax=Saccharothrix coeruleofusca TaxID=33919 RepID=UPI001AE897F7|nr:hypothetical protein [Saccharothrix coeruleofusca]MBP2339301.1 hypothetical protein [Saccharothrix coeruleofusca]